MAQHYTDEEIEQIGRKFNKIFTMFQKLDKKLGNWKPLSKDTKDKWVKILAQQQIMVLDRQVKLANKQIKEMQRHTNWFIYLTITNIIVLVITLIINLR